jgi:hypothetical protein
MEKEGENVGLMAFVLPFVLKQKQRKARVIEELNKKIEGEFSSAYCVPNLLAPL